MKGLVFNIQRFSIHDGPGIRTTVFLKGCNLRCFWCHNPESINPGPELQLFLQKCIGCGKCFEICPVNAHQVIDGQRVFLREICSGCGKCAEFCYAEALVMAGEEMTVEEVVEEVEKDKAFYDNSGGGVTLSGGEALLQKDFAKAILIESKKRGLHTVVDTAGNVPWQLFEEVLPYVDLFLYDIKVLDDKKHRRATGVGNERILDNFSKLAMAGKDICIRIPVIPNLNDNKEEMEKMAAFIKGLNGIHTVELLPFHGLGEGKYESLGMEYQAKGYISPSDDHIIQLMEAFSAIGLIVKKG